jgi:hypothetical protein
MFNLLCVEFALLLDGADQHQWSLVRSVDPRPGVGYDARQRWTSDYQKITAGIRAGGCRRR